MSKIVFRTLDVFEAFAQAQRPLSLTELAKQLGIPASSCHDVLSALEERGYLYEPRPRAGYYPTARLFELARTVHEHDPVSLRAEPLLEQLSAQLSASVSLAKAKGLQLTYLVVRNSPNPLHFSVTTGATVRNLYATSAGKALLGQLPAEEQQAFLRSIELKPMTPYTQTSVEDLLQELRESEKRGWYVNREESVEDALTISTRFQWGGAIYVLTAAGPLKRMDRQFEEAVQALRESARQLQLGMP